MVLPEGRFGIRAEDITANDLRAEVACNTKETATRGFFLYTR